MRYVDYRNRNGLGEYNINFNALDPFMKIEGEMVHDMALKILKKRIDRGLKPEKVTRRLSVEIIRKANDKVAEGDKLDSLTGLENRFGKESAIYGITETTHKEYYKLREQSEYESNESFIKAMLKFCSDRLGDFIETETVV
jgi:hypothetical protein